MDEEAVHSEQGDVAVPDPDATPTGSPVLLGDLMDPQPVPAFDDVLFEPDSPSSIVGGSLAGDPPSAPANLDDLFGGSDGSSAADEPPEQAFEDQLPLLDDFFPPVPLRSP